MVEMSRNMMKGHRLLSWLILFLFSVPCCLKFLGIIKFQLIQYDYWLYGISDWLINYEGGFVRRGIVGQILWIVEQYYSYDPRTAILLVVIVSSISILFLIVRLFTKNGWSLLIIPTGFCLGFLFLNIEVRRDCLSLLLTFFIFLNYKKLMLHPKKWSIWFLFYVLSIFQILMQEASFFYTFPLLMLCCYMNKDDQGCSTCIKLGKCLLQFIPILVTMLLACTFKGNEDIVNIIWNSWKEVFAIYDTNYPLTEIGLGVKALAWDSSMTFKNHLCWAYLGYNSPSYWNILFVFINWMAAYYLLTCLNVADMCIYPKQRMDNVLMSNVVFVQFVAMLPLFTFLSCDWGRTIPYWVLSSLFFYHIFKCNRLLFPIPLSCLSERIQTAISHNRLLYSPYTYILIILLTPVPFCFAPLDGVTLQEILLDMIVKKLNLMRSLLF